MKNYTHSLKNLIAVLTCFFAVGQAFALGTTTIDGKKFRTIENCADLAAFASLVNGGSYTANAIVTQTVDCSTQASFDPIGKDDTHKYQGTFKGAGYVITKLSINLPENGSQYGGLIGYLGQQGVVEDVILYNLMINHPTSQGANDFIGGIAGKSEGTIRTCTVAGETPTGAHAAIEGRRNVGGIVGYATSTARIENSLCTASLYAEGRGDHDQYTSTNTSSSMATYVGGIVGRGEAGAVVSSCVYGGNSITRQSGYDMNIFPIAGGPVTKENNYYSSEYLPSGSAGTPAGNCGDDGVEQGYCSWGYDETSCVAAGGSWTKATWKDPKTSPPKCTINGQDVFSNQTRCETVGGEWLASACGTGTSDLTDEAVICNLNKGTMVGDVCYGEQNDIWRDNGDITNHVTVKSTGDETSYAIIFNPNGGSFAGRTTPDTIYVVVNGEIESARTANHLTEPVRSTDEDVFVGWAKTYNANTELSDLGTVTGSVTFYAVWEKSIVVSFDANGGEFPNNPVTNKRVAKNRAIDTVGISVPSARGATFLGWSRNKNATVADETLGSSSDPVTFYAVYSGNYKVSFNSNGGSFSSGATREKTVSVGADFTAEGITQPNPPSGYTFAGWSLDQNADASEAISSSSAVIGTMRVSEITVYAVWSAKTWTITFDPNGGYFDNQNNSTGKAPKTKTFIDGEKINSNGISTTNPPVKRAKSGSTNYTFIGWAEISSSSTVLKDLGTASENKTFYAVWATSGTYYTVTFDVNGFGSIPEDQRVKKTDGRVTPPTVVLPVGATFEGWYTEAACTNKFNFDKAVSKDMTLYAKWNVNTHTVEYKVFDAAMGTEIAEEGSSTTVSYGTKVPVTTKKMAGYSYTPWQSESDNVIFADDGSFVMPDNDVELYCFRSTGVYTLTWDLKDGEDVSFEGEYSPAGQYNFGDTIYAPILKRDGYTFEGWTLDGELLVDFPREMPSTNTKFYAKWKENGPYKLTIQVVGAPANVPIPSGVPGGTSVTLTVPDFTPSAMGALYHFLGWEENYSDIEISSSNTFTMPNYDVRIIAKFVQKPVILYTKGECSTCTGDDIQIIKEYGASYTIKGSSDKVFSRTGYEHKGWTTVEGGSAVEYAFGATYSGNDNLTLYPVWEAVTLNLAWNFTLPEGWSADDISYGEFSAGSYSYDTQLDKPTVSKFGYDVDWYTTSACAANPAGTGCTAWNFDEDKLVGSQDETITLYGHAVKRTLTVTYHVLRETGGSDAYYFTKDYTIDDLYDSKYLYYNINEYIDIPEDRIYVNGFGYVVWYKTSACTELATFLNFRSNGDFNTSVELYGLVDGYKITYHAGTGATGFDFVGRKTVGEDYTLEGAGRFTRVGYTQVGWTRTDGGTKALDLGATYNVDVGMESGLDLYPAWAQNRTITLHLGDALFAETSSSSVETSSSSIYTPVSGSSGVYTATVHDGQKLEQPALYKLGYQNEKWFDSEDCANGTATSCSSWNFENDVISGNTELYAGAWEKIVKTITFHYAETSFDSTYSIDDVNNGSLLVFGNPGRFENIDFIEGYGYIDWYRDEGFEEKAWGLNLGANANFKDQDVYGELSGYKVTYKPGANGSGDEVEDAVYLEWFEEGAKGYNLRPATTFTRTGYSLTGWSETEDGDKAFDVDAEYKPTANATFYPVWTPVFYTITYMDGAAELDAQLNDAENPATYTIETAVTLKNAKEKVDGETHYLFDGWFSEAGFENSVASIPLGSYGNKELYAKYTAGVAITYKVNDATHVDYAIPETALVPFDTSKTGYSFSGWTWFDGENTEPLATAPTVAKAGLRAEGTLTLNVYEASFNANGGEFAAAATISKEVNFNADISAEGISIPTYAGHKFMGWAREASALEPDANLGKMDAEGVTFYAVWEDAYTIVYNMNGHGDEIAPAIYVLGSAAVAPTDPEVEGYTFGGWFTDDGEFKNAYDFASVVSTVQTINLYAKWTAHQHTVTYRFKIAEGNYDVIQTDNVDYGESVFFENVVKGEKFDRVGYENIVWTPNTVWFKGGFPMPDNDVIVEGTGNPKNYPIVYHLPDGTSSSSNYTYSETDDFTLPTNIEVTDWTFSNWYDNAEHTGDAVTKIEKGTYGEKVFYGLYTQVITVTIGENTIPVTIDNDDDADDINEKILAEAHKQGIEDPTKTDPDGKVTYEFEKYDCTAGVSGYTCEDVFTEINTEYTVAVNLPEGASLVCTEGATGAENCSADGKSIKYQYGEGASELPAAEMEGWTFDRWVDGSGNTVSSIGAEEFGNKSITPVFEKDITVTIGEKTFPVTIDNDDDADDINEKILVEAHKQGIEDPTKTDPDGKVTYEFEKYNCTAGASGYTCEDVFTETYTEYTVAVNLPEGASLVCTGDPLPTGAENCSADGKSIKYQYGEGASELPAAEMEGWTFDRWVDGSGNTVSSIGAEEFGNKSITPVFEKDITVTIGEKTFPVTIDNDDDADDINEKILAEAHKQGIEDPTKTDPDGKVTYEFEKYNCTAGASGYTCEDIFTETYTEYTVAVNLPEGASLVCTEGADGAENCSADGKSIKYQYGEGASELPAAEMEGWTFDRWVDGSGNTVSSIGAEEFGNKSITPVFEKDITVTIGEKTFPVTIDSDDDADDINEKILAEAHKQGIEDPTKTDPDGKVTYEFEKYNCTAGASGYTCDDVFTETYTEYTVAVNLPEGASLVCTEGATGAENCSADGKSIKYQYGEGASELPAAEMEGWTFDRWVDGSGNTVSSIGAEEFGNKSITPVFEKDITVTIGEKTFPVTIDSDDDADDINEKILAEAHKQGIEDPTKDSDDKYDYTFEKYECSEEAGVYTCEEKFNATGRVFEVAVNLPDNAALVCTEGADGAENCSADGENIEHKYGVETTPLPDAEMTKMVDGATVTDESWKFEGWFDNKDGFDDGTNGNKVTSIDAKAYGDDIEVFPYFTKEVEIALDVTKPATVIDVVIDNNDNADSVSAKVTKAAAEHEPPIEPTPKHIEEEPLNIDFAGYECKASGDAYDCEAVYDTTGMTYEVAVNLPDNAALVCTEGAKGAEFCNATKDSIEHTYGIDTKPLPDAIIVDKLGKTDSSWEFLGWFDNADGIDNDTNGHKVDSIAAEAFGSDLEIFPYFEKVIHVVLSEDPLQEVDVVIDNNDDVDSVGIKVTKAAEEKGYENPKKDSDGKYDYVFSGYECTEVDGSYECEAGFDRTPIVFEVAVNLPANAKLICDAGAKGAENCAEYGKAIYHTYGIETAPLPDVAIVDGKGVVDDSWTFEGWFDNKNGIADGTNGNKISSIEANATNGESIYPYLTKTVVAKIGDETVEVVIDNNDTKDSINAKVTKAAEDRDPPIPTPKKDKDSEYEYEFASYECDANFVCEPTFDKNPYAVDIVVVYGDGDGDTLHVTISSTDSDEDIEKAIEDAMANHEPPIKNPTKADDAHYVYDFDKFVKDPETGNYVPSFTKTSKVYKIAYNMPNGGKLDKDVKSYVYGTTTVLPGASIVSDTSWEFKGWYTEEKGLGVRVKFIGETEIGDKNFYPLFQKTIAYETDDLKGEIVVIYENDPTKTINRALSGLVPEDFDKDGVTYTFDKWVLKDNVYTPTFTEATGMNAAVDRHFSVVVNGHSLEINGAPTDARIAVFNMSGRMVAQGIVENGTQRVELTTPGSYVVRVNNQVVRVNVR